MTKTYMVDVIKTYMIEIDDDEDISFMSSIFIEENGDLKNIETSVIENLTEEQDISDSVGYKEWWVECPSCGGFAQFQKNDPVLCPKCQCTDIETQLM